MKVDVVLCCAPVMSVVRPSAALGLLQAALSERGVAVRSLYLNLLFAERIGIDLNELIAEKAPAHLLIGDWMFAPCLGPSPVRPEVARHLAEVEELLRRRDMERVKDIREGIAARFVDAAAGSILERRPRIVGFSTMFQQTAASLAIAAAVKRAAPDTVVVFGGANCHGPMGEVLLRHYPQIDHVFTGEADTAFPDFVQALLSGPGHRRGSVHALPVMQMDELPIPDYADYFTQIGDMAEAVRIRPSIPFESSRGCWWGQKHHCTFCGLNAQGMTFRAKSSERVLHELEVLGARHGIRRFAAADNIMGLPHVAGVMARLAEDGEDASGRTLFYEIKSNMDEAQIETLADAGVVQVQPGIESLSDDVLSIMRKGVDTLINIRVMRNCRSLGMGVIWSILYGFPGEPRIAYDEMAAMVPDLEHLQPPNGVVRIRLDRFSPNHGQADRFGFHDVRPVPAYGAIYDIPGRDLPDLAYFFEAEAPDAATEEDVARLRQAVARWRSLWYDGSPPPQLAMVRVGPGALVKDTRSIARAPLHYLEPPAVALLDGLRSPASLPTLVEALSIHHPREAVEAAVAQVTELRFVIRQGRKALSLVLDTGRSRFTEEARLDQPLGWLADAPDAVEPCPDRLGMLAGTSGEGGREERS